MGIWRIHGGTAFDQQGHPGWHQGTDLTVTDPSNRVISLRNNDMVFPGLIDFHAHVDNGPGPLGVSQGQLISSGVMVVGDAGTRGWANNCQGAQQWRALPIIKEWLNMIPDGLAQYPVVPYFRGLTEEQGIQITERINSQRERVVGLKIRLGQHDFTEDRRLLEAGSTFAQSCKVPLMVHITGTFLTAEEIFESLRAGDVLTHVFHGRMGSLDRDRRSVSSLIASVDNGVILDIGHGTRHFSWSVFHRLRAEGILPDTISTDVTQLSWRKTPLYDLPFVCSKLLAAGLSWTDIYRGIVTNPLRYFSEALPTDSIVVLRYWPRRVGFPDAEGQVVVADGMWRPVLVVASGHVIKNLLSHSEV
ncbi:MAG: amidohydrolase [Firmicutes bacterium]|nr:amidohydrolase [Bacillota bacterium]